MRLFRFGLWIVVFVLGCKSGEVPNAGALRVSLSYATFRPGCLTLKAEDREDPSRFEQQQLELGARPERSKTLTVAVFRKEGWSRQLRLTATAFERSCAEQNPRQVATQTVEQEVPAEGILAVDMDLRAQDLDDDTYVQTAQGGSDCNDDDPAVNPGITEDCDGQDDNCSGDESDAPGIVTFYADLDQDSYGNPASRQLACVKPAGTVTNGGDCKDNDSTVHPDQPEPLCNGLDENCDNVVDDTFNAGTSCNTSQGCPGLFVCAAGGTSSECQSSQSPVEWYVDQDGDGHAGTSTGLGCTAPVPGAVQLKDDCDDSARFVFNGGTERCDRLDNNCNTQTDEGVCGAVSWQEVPNTNSNSSTNWIAVAAYAENKAWVAAGAGALTHIEGSVATQLTDCPGNWVSAWARPSDGRVFLGSLDGTIATRAVTGTTACAPVSTGNSAPINGLVGFESGPTTTLFAVTSNGHIYRWTYPGVQPPVEVALFAANLRAIHGTSPTNLLAVGVESGGSGAPRAFRFNPDNGTWSQESLPASLPNDFLRDVHMVHSQLAYAVGDQGVLLERSNGTWKALPAPSGTPDLVGLTAYGRTSIYAVSNTDKEVYLFNGTSWLSEHSPSWTPNAIDGVGPQDLWVAGSQATVLHWGP